MGPLSLLPRNCCWQAGPPMNSNPLSCHAATASSTRGRVGFLIAWAHHKRKSQSPVDPKSLKYPNRLVLAFFYYLALLFCKEFLFSCFSHLSQDLGGFGGEKINPFLVVFLAFCQESKEKKIRVDKEVAIWVRQAIAFAIVFEFCRKLPFARNFCSEDEIFAISFAKPFVFASEFLPNAWFAAFCLRFCGENFLAHFRGASEFAFAFAFAAVSQHSGYNILIWKEGYEGVLPQNARVSRGLRHNLLILNKGAITSLTFFKPIAIATIEWFRHTQLIAMAAPYNLCSQREGYSSKG